MNDSRPDQVRQQEVTRLLEQVRNRDAAAGDELFSIVYRELRQIAQGIMRNHPQGHTLQPTALIHEAWLKLVDNFGLICN